MGEAQEIARLSLLEQDNRQRMAALAAEGINLDGLGQLSIITLLDHIVVMLGGEAALRKAQLDLAGQVSHILDEGEKSVDAMKRQAAAAKLGLDPRGLDPLSIPGGTNGTRS